MTSHELVGLYVDAHIRHYLGDVSCCFSTDVICEQDRSRWVWVL